MIVQSAPVGRVNLVILQTDHARLAGQFAKAFGNTEFAPIKPLEPMLFVATHHDEGWIEIDARMEQDPRTGLPFHLTHTPLPQLIVTSSRSPAFNETFHPYSGILSSMHSYGLFNGRYGLSDKIFIDDIPAEHRAAVEEMLRGELDRQERLIDSLHLDHEYALLINEARLFHNYKLLEFFDTLALYFQMTHPQERKISEFTNVPRAVGDDITVTITPLKSGAYALSPYPFRQDSMTFSYGGRYLSAQEPGANMRQLWNAAQSYSEPIQIVRG